MSLMEKLGTILTAAGKMAQANQISKWLDMDFAQAQNEIEYMVNNYPPEVIDTYEVLFLKASAFVIDPDQRIRLIQLYSWLKLLETNRFGFRGFANVSI